METRYYYDKRIYHQFGSLTEVRGKATKMSFMVKSTTPIFGTATWDVRIPIGTSYLFTDRAQAVEFSKKKLKEQMDSVLLYVEDVKEFIESGV